MFRRRKKHAYLDEVSDPLARRIGLRTLKEADRKNMKKALWDGAHSGAHGGARANSASGSLGLLALFFVWMMWAVISSIIEEIVSHFTTRQRAARKERDTRPKVRVHYHEV